ncbi:MAG: TetR/AcrR family transcriptional regulator [Haliea sp.]|nr:TetR/AcrR family transcriptional regulator [Haliea sp.]
MPNSTATAVERPEQRRNKGFEDTHQQMIETAVRLISAKGVDSLSIAAIARAMNINRTTVYYHFDSRDALLEAVKHWSAAQLARGLAVALPQQERMDFVTRFVLENPALITLWIDDFIAPGDIRTRYPMWDALVEGMAATFAARPPEEPVDAEIYCVMLLTSAIIGPRVFINSVDPASDIDTVVQRFRQEQQRMLRHDALFRER